MKAHLSNPSKSKRKLSIYCSSKSIANPSEDELHQDELHQDDLKEKDEFISFFQNRPRQNS